MGSYKQGGEWPSKALLTVTMPLWQSKGRFGPLCTCISKEMGILSISVVAYGGNKISENCVLEDSLNL